MTHDMNAAVVTDFSRPPVHDRFPVPDVTDGTELVQVVAAGLHPRVRTGARGAHYTSTGTLPMVPGIDGVGRRADGSHVYFAAADDALGTMAQWALVDPRRAVTLPAGTDPLKVAAAVNPAMSSWVALRRRVALAPGASVLVLGATGNAGTMAVQVARHLGAGRIVGAGRDHARLRALAAVGADEVVALTDDTDVTSRALAAAAADVDLVIDYLWGEPAQLTLAALLHGRADRSAPLDWVQIGAITGPEITLPSAYLRSANLRLQGSGQGSVAPADYLAELPSLIAEIDAGTIAVTPRPMPLSQVTEAWAMPDVPGERIVLVPDEQAPEARGAQR